MQILHWLNCHKGKRKNLIETSNFTWQPTNLRCYEADTLGHVVKRGRKMWMCILIRTVLSFLEGFTFAHINLGSCQSSLQISRLMCWQVEESYRRISNRPHLPSAAASSTKSNCVCENVLNIKEGRIWSNRGLEEIEVYIRMQKKEDFIPSVAFYM